jgi:hypothetical protein
MTNYSDTLEKRFEAKIRDVIRRLAAAEQQIVQLQSSANPVAFRMYQTAAQTIANTTDTQVTCDTSHYDTASGRGLSTPWNYVVPAGAGGLRQLAFMVPYSANTTGSRAQYLKVNGLRLTAGTETVDISANNDITAAVGIVTIPLNPGDSVALWTWHNAGGPLALLATNVAQPFLEGRRVSLVTP